MNNKHCEHNPIMICEVCRSNKLQNYERNHSHTHCWNQGTPACGQELSKHKQCCLCDKVYKPNKEKCTDKNCPIPILDHDHLISPTPSHSWEEEFDSAFDWIEKEKERCKIMYGFTSEDLKAFISKTLQEQKEKLDIWNLPSLKEGHRMDGISYIAGRDMERDRIRKLVEGNKKEVREYNWHNLAYNIIAKHYNKALDDIINNLEEE